VAQPNLITFNDDGAWCWFQDERALIHKNRLIVGSVQIRCAAATSKQP
jgi:hypothetical protein